MTNAHYFDEDPLVEGEVDGAVREMARRQFGVSLAVGFALLAIAGLSVMRASHEAPAQMAQVAAHHRIIRVEAPQPQFAQPVQQAQPKG
jgi:hypothetical protein